MEAIAVITVAALLEYFVFAALVARVRVLTGIKPPATFGEPVFERHFRVHQNTLEQLIIFLPALWIFGYYVDPLWGAAVGAIFIINMPGTQRKKTSQYSSGDQHVQDSRARESAIP